MSDNLGQEPVSPLREAALMAHEMYNELKLAGFSRREALELLAKMLTASQSMGND